VWGARHLTRAVRHSPIECEKNEAVVVWPMTGNRRRADVGVAERLDQPDTGRAWLDFAFPESAEVRLEHRDCVHERLGHRHVEIIHDQHQLLGIRGDTGPLQRR
jgi:hypothetical protein